MNGRFSAERRTPEPLTRHVALADRFTRDLLPGAQADAAMIRMGKALAGPLRSEQVSITAPTTARLPTAPIGR